MNDFLVRRLRDGHFSPNSLLLGVLNALKNGRLGAGWSGRVPGRLVSHFLSFVSQFFSFVSQAGCLWSGSRLACLPLSFVSHFFSCVSHFHSFVPPLLFICLPVLFIVFCLPGWVLVVGFPAGLSPISFHLSPTSFHLSPSSFHPRLRRVPACPVPGWLVSHFLAFVSHFLLFVSHFFSFVPAGLSPTSLICLPFPLIVSQFFSFVSQSGCL